MKWTLVFALIAACLAFAAAQMPAFIEAEVGDAPATQVATIASNSAAPLNEDEKLDAALQALGEDIIAKSKQIKNEETWVGEVKKIIKLYSQKLKRVVGNVKTLREEVRKLYIKKRQIQNLKIQRALEKRMEEADADLKTLDSKLDLVKTRATEFTRTRKGITNTIGQLKSKLNELKGVKPAAKPAAKPPAKKF
jgi:chromosome segregation ATPase